MERECDRGLRGAGVGMMVGKECGSGDGCGDCGEVGADMRDLIVERVVGN